VLIAVLGPVEAERDGVPVALGVREQRALLAALALTPGRVVTASALIDLLWPDGAPPAALATLQTYIAGLRRTLEPERAARSAAEIVVTAETGYVLRVPAEAIDAVRFERAVTAARRALGPAASDVLGEIGPDPERTRSALAEGRALWRGTPYAELGSAPAAEAERVRLGELRLVAEELTAAVRLAEGDSAALAADLEPLIGEHPLRERLWALRAVALARAGRQADALAALREIRALLADELGVDPGPELRRVEEAVLRQDPAVTATPGAPAAAPARHAPASSAAPAAPWPLVGRTAQLARR
jgi:DNA-binding SARP family transcriptional activator